ncbi:hypothetical protein EST38_g5681 [Candolleomyces aberdarensis]|uniref:Nephrocystin 3-like N-terminal domain-containing protein n=1 Tax=Candolleomyces aberdarensis TaxID=2316362 RepID=A0A4Q2DLW6_9AGAR|nr:hypothetical protein EST38_g5681 [Candolleomyces aberdarensis]
MSIQSFPERDTEITLHPLDATNRQLLHLTNADFALTHDDVWRFALENKTLDDVDSFDALRTSSVSICNGVAFLVYGELQKQDLSNAPNATHVSTFNDEDLQHKALEVDSRSPDVHQKCSDMTGKLAKSLPKGCKPDAEAICEWEPNSTDRPNATHIKTFDVESLHYDPDSFEFDKTRLVVLPKHPDMNRKRVGYLLDSRKREVEELCERELSGTELVLCIHGPAGIGKSTLARLLSDKYRSAGRLGASVFMDTFPTDTSGPETITKMIAHEIGSIHPRAIPKIVEAMDQCHGTSLETHLQNYILEPLRALGHPQPLIIVLDAMDEWRDHPIFIKTLALLNSESSVVKFIITGRLNPCTSHLPGIESVSIYTYTLGPVSKGVIRAYFRKYLETVPWVDGRKASSVDVKKLTELSSGLFIHASTVIALLSHTSDESPPHKTLAEVVGNRRQVGGTEGLEDLYLIGLRTLFPDPDAQKHYRQYLGETTVLQETLSLLDFSTLGEIPSRLVKDTQFSLATFQTRFPSSGSEKVVYPAQMLFHLSFLDFVEAKTEISFMISAFDSHSALGLGCLKQIAKLSPLSPDQAPIPGYAVKYWPLHVSKGTPRSKSQFSQTEHWSTLQTMPANNIRQWAGLFLKKLLPHQDELMVQNVRAEFDMVSILLKLANVLGGSGGDQWGLQVACLEVAVRIDDESAEAWSNLGSCYRARSDTTRSFQMYEDAVVKFQHGLYLPSHPHHDRVELLGEAAIKSCHRRCEEKASILGEAIYCFHKALALRPVPHPDRPTSLNNLGAALRARYVDCEIASLHDSEAISLHLEALSMLPAPHTGRFTSLNNECDGEIATLNEVIRLRREALELLSAPHPDCSRSLDNVLQYLHQRDDGITTLNEAIRLDREALELLLAHPDRSTLLNNLADALQALYERNGEIATLDEAVLLYCEALALRPAPHPERSTSLNNLSNALRALYERDGKITTLNEAIRLHREAL